MKNGNGRWYALGDINAFFGLSLDNIAGLVMVVGILVNQFGVPSDFALTCLVPGTAIGVLVGDLLYFLLALIVMAKTKRVMTAMPLGLDTPSVFGMSYFVLGPSFLHAKDDLGMEVDAAANYMWEIGIGCVFFAGLFKFVCAFTSRWAQQSFPRAGLLGSLASVALVIISFLPLLDILESPIVGLIALAIVLTALVGHVPVPGRTPGVLAALVVAGSLHYLMQYAGLHLHDMRPQSQLQQVFLPSEWMQAWQFHWLSRLDEAAAYLPVVLPLALATVIGGIDCSESAQAAGDHYPAGWVVGIEAFATLVASLCGGVIQNTPYIGHPAYKAMGGRCAYTLATALFIGAAGLLGFFGTFYAWIPPSAVFPILIFVGLEITSQSFLATPRRHYPAVALSCIPALAFLSIYFANQILVDPNVRIQAPSSPMAANATQSPSDLPPSANSRTEPTSDPVQPPSQENATSPPSDNASTTPSAPPRLANTKLERGMAIANLLSRGFIVTSLLWASLLAMVIDRRLAKASLFAFLCALLTLFGVIHSPLPSGALYLPLAIPGLPNEWALSPNLQPTIFHWAIAYASVGMLLLGWDRYLQNIGLAGTPYDPPHHEETA